MTIVKKTAQGRKVSILTFFKKDEDRQHEYEDKVIAKIDALEEQWDKSYKPALHDTLVEEMVRSGLMCFYYEKLIANADQKELTFDLLKAERAHLGSIRDKLLISLKQVKHEEPVGEDNKAPTIFSLVKQSRDAKEAKKKEEQK